MKMHTTLSNSEWIIMERLWQQPHSLMELVSELGESVGWSKSTIATMVRRMEAKGLISYSEKGRTKIFSPAISQSEITTAETQSLLQRAYHGSIGLLFSTMVQSNTLTKSEIDELYAILAKAEEGTK